MNIQNMSFFQYRALVAVVLAAVLLSLGGVLIKSIAWDPVAIAGVRSAIAALALAALYPDLRLRASYLLIVGSIGYTIMMLLFVIATKLTTAANAIFLYYAAPIAMALFSPWFFGKRMTRRDMTLIGITLAGIGLFFLDHLTVTNLWGNIAAIVSGVAFAGTALLTRKLGKDAIAPLFVGNVLVAVLALPFIAAIPGPDVSGWVMLVVLGVCQVGCAYALFADGIKHLPALNLIVLSGIEPILNPLWVLLVLGELPSHWALIGGMAILASLMLRGVMNAREARQESI